MSSGKRATTTRETTVQEAIRQTRPFRSPGQEALIALMLTAEAVRWPLQELLDKRGLTPQQYNVLRILRGAGRGGLPTLEIAERMIERTPGISRLIDRLERKELVTRERSADDRRQVVCTITAEGLAVLRSLDRPVDKLDDDLLAPLSAKETRELIRLLNLVRNGV